MAVRLVHIVHIRSSADGMVNNRGKKFEQVIREAFEKVPGVSIDRIPDQTMRYRGAQNICDFIVYKEPYEYYIECKSVHGNTLPFSNISSAQWEGLLKKSKIEGVFAGVLCWWIDKDVTKFIPIQVLEDEKYREAKSIRYDADLGLGFVNNNGILVPIVQIQGKKKRVFFDYDMEQFFKEVVNGEV